MFGSVKCVFVDLEKAYECGAKKELRYCEVTVESAVAAREHYAGHVQGQRDSR